jgi:hypothetical protein
MLLKTDAVHGISSNNIRSIGARKVRTFIGSKGPNRSVSCLETSLTEARDFPLCQAHLRHPPTDN